MAEFIFGLLCLSLDLQSLQEKGGSAPLLRKIIPSIDPGWEQKFVGLFELKWAGRAECIVMEGCNYL